MEITKWSNAFPGGWYISDSGEYVKLCDCNDESIGWCELGEILLNALCCQMGEEGYHKWLEAQAAKEAQDERR